jgi:hypothetical protein
MNMATIGNHSRVLFAVFATRAVAALSAALARHPIATGPNHHDAPF